MRERQQLADRVGAVKSLERDLNDAVEYAELADMEADEASLEDARTQLKGIRERAARAELLELPRADHSLNVRGNKNATASAHAEFIRAFGRWLG